MRRQRKEGKSGNKSGRLRTGRHEISFFGFNIFVYSFVTTAGMRG